MGHAPSRVDSIYPRSRGYRRASVPRAPCHSVRLGTAPHRRPEKRTDRRQLVQQPSLKLARLDFVLFTREFVDDGDRALESRIRSRNSEARYHWIFSPLSVRIPSSKGQIRARCLFPRKSSGGTHFVARVPFAHRHLIGLRRCRSRSWSMCRRPSRS